MKRDIVFWSSKRFKFEKIEENDFRFDGTKMTDRKGLKLVIWTWFAFACKDEPTLIKTFSWKTKYSAIQTQVRTWLERHLRINTQFLKKSLSVTRSNSLFTNKIQRYFSTCAITKKSLETSPLEHLCVFVKHVLKSAWVIFRVLFEARLKNPDFT